MDGECKQQPNGDVLALLYQVRLTSRPFDQPAPDFQGQALLQVNPGRAASRQVSTAGKVPSGAVRRPARCSAPVPVRRPSRCAREVTHGWGRRHGGAPADATPASWLPSRRHGAHPWLARCAASPSPITVPVRGQSTGRHND